LKTIVVGVGNLVRRDDGAGIHVVNRLKHRAPWIDSIDVAMGSVEILEAIKGYDRAIIVDAIQSGAEPGEILHIDTAAADNPPSLYSSHGVDIFTTLELGKRIFKDEMPKEQIIIGIEAEDTLDYSTSCSPRVELAIEKVVNEIITIEDSGEALSVLKRDPHAP
jgi:hydrogenase maturation protease